MQPPEGIGGPRERAVLDLFETAEVIALTLDREGRITYCNQYMAELTGLRRDELIGLQYFDTFEPYHPVEHPMGDLIARVQQQGATPYDETLMYMPSGERRMVAWSDTFLRDERGEITGTISIGHDISEQSRSRSRLALQLEVARALSAATTFEEGLTGVLEALSRRGDSRTAALWLVEGDVLAPAVLYALDEADEADRAQIEAWRAARPRRGEGFAGEAWATGDIAFPPGGFVFPARWHGEIVAVLEIAGAEHVNSDEGVLPLAVGLGDSVASFLHRHRTEDELRRVAEEQASLHRVAALVAREGAEDEIFGTVTEEIGRLHSAHDATMVRYFEDGSATLVGFWNEDARTHEQLGDRFEIGGPTALARVLQTGEPARVDDYTDLEGPLVTHIRDELGLRCAIAAPVFLGGRLWGAVSAASRRSGAFPPGAEHRLAQFAELVAQALANAEAARALTASRIRLVQSGDAERRRLERNLHDGAQQRLVGLALALRLAENRVVSDPESAVAQLEAARAELAEALDDLRELARGIHPAVLSNHGLRAALPALADRSTVPVEVEVDVERLPEAIEVAAYYAASEALANVAKYAGATHAELRAACRDGALELSVADDGVGGADPSLGSGLQGLADRVEALGGRLAVASPPGEGTRVTVRLPLP